MVYAIGAALRRHDPVLVLVLAGIVVGTLLGSGVSLLKYLADPVQPAPGDHVLAARQPRRRVTAATCSRRCPAVLVGLVPLWLLRWRMNVMTLGEDEARALGVDTRRVRARRHRAATLMTAAAVSVSGVIGWIGLLIPHVARLLVGPDFARLLPALDAARRRLPARRRHAGPHDRRRIEIPLGVLTAFIGAPFFIWLLALARRGWQ